MASGATSMNFATVVATIIPAVPSFPTITFKAETFFNEEEFLSDPQPANDRARQFMSNDGETVQYIDKFAINGKRDLTIYDNDIADQIIHMAMSNPQPMFDFSFQYQRNDQDSSKAITQFHKNCKIMNHPSRTLSHDIIVIKFNIAYAKLINLNSAGNPV